MKRRKLPALLTALALALTMAGPALAAPSSDHISVSKPKDKAVYYVGESIPVAATFTKYELGPLYDEISAYDVTLWNGALTVWNDELVDNPETDSGTVPPTLFPDGSTYSYRQTIPTAGLKPGSYGLQFGFFGHLKEQPVQTSAPAEEPENVDEWVELDLTLRRLKPPAGLKAAAGKKKVAITWKKASGAKQYEVQRSLLKKSGFKTLATVTKTGFTDKKVTAGQRYSYRVRSVRGKVKSAWTPPRLSGKVQNVRKPAGTVYYTPSGKYYHRKSCTTLKRSRKIRKTTVKKAKAKKLRACKVCRP